MPLNYSDVLIGALTTAFGAILVMIWDYYKMNRESQEKEKKMLLGLIHEITVNQGIVKANLKFLKEERDFLAEKMHIVSPLVPFEDEMWSVIKMNIPKKLLDNQIFYNAVITYSLIRYTNEIIRSREDFRNQNGALSTYNDKISKYDQILLEKINFIKDKLINLNRSLEMFFVKIKADETGAYYEAVDSTFLIP